ncbi:MAG: hypothetical protein MZV70_40900 [Desulfobacterales bacterium]|nr:hypothetical protein [Desulfobacterales bacterium]
MLARSRPRRPAARHPAPPGGPDPRRSSGARATWRCCWNTRRRWRHLVKLGGRQPLDRLVSGAAPGAAGRAARPAHASIGRPAARGHRRRAPAPPRPRPGRRPGGPDRGAVHLQADQRAAGGRGRRQRPAAAHAGQRLSLGHRRGRRSTPWSTWPGGTWWNGTARRSAV